MPDYPDPALDFLALRTSLELVIERRREELAALEAALAAITPTPPPARRPGRPRTAIASTNGAPPPARTHTRSTKLAAQRAATAQLLTTIARRTTPTPAKEIKGVGILVARGYLQKEGSGFVRTSKPFVP